MEQREGREVRLGPPTAPYSLPRPRTLRTEVWARPVCERSPQSPWPHRRKGGGIPCQRLQRWPPWDGGSPGGGLSGRGAALRGGRPTPEGAGPLSSAGLHRDGRQRGTRRVWERRATKAECGPHRHPLQTHVAHSAAPTWGRNEYVH